MGSSVLSINAAAELLDVTPQTVHHLIRQGVFTPVYEQDGRRISRPTLRKEAVEAYAESKREGVSPQRMMILVQQAAAQSKALERRVAFLEDALGARLNPPPMDEDSVISVFAEADEDLELVPTNVSRILRWARFFIAVGEEFFDMLTAVTDDESSWMVFSDLAQVIAESAPRELFEFDQDLRVAFSYFEVGRRNLRAVLFMHLRGRLGIRGATRALGEVEDIHDEVLNFASVEIASSRARR